jgi:hypothetical protein
MPRVYIEKFQLGRAINKVRRAARSSGEAKLIDRAAGISMVVRRDEPFAQITRRYSLHYIARIERNISELQAACERNRMNLESILSNAEEINASLDWFASSMLKMAEDLAATIGFSNAQLDFRRRMQELAAAEQRRRVDSGAPPGLWKR